jgi:hypothetical protein
MAKKKSSVVLVHVSGASPEEAVEVLRSVTGYLRVAGKKRVLAEPVDAAPAETAVLLKEGGLLDEKGNIRPYSTGAAVAAMRDLRTALNNAWDVEPETLMELGISEATYGRILQWRHGKAMPKRKKTRPLWWRSRGNLILNGNGNRVAAATDPEGARAIVDVVNSLKDELAEAQAK